MKTQALDWKAFIGGQIITTTPQATVGMVGKTVTGMYMLFLPERALAAAEAANSGSWTRLFEKLMEISDYVDGGLIIYAGYVLMFGNRTRSTELLFGSSIGYIIIRHWKDIQNFLKEF